MLGWIEAGGLLVGVLVAVVLSVVSVRSSRRSWEGSVYKVLALGHAGLLVVMPVLACIVLSLTVDGHYSSLAVLGLTMIAVFLGSGMSVVLSGVVLLLAWERGRRGEGSA